MSRGFTLIESLIYIALFTIIVGGLFASAFGFFESMGRNQSRSTLQTEQDFMLAKIDWVLEGAHTVSVPSATSLSVNKWNTGYGNPIQLCLAGSDLRILYGAGTCITAGRVLNGGDVTVSNLTFIRTVSAGINAPEIIEAGFTVSLRTPNGATISQTASTTRYLHK